MKKYKGVIFNITLNKYVASDVAGVLVYTKKIGKALEFYDEDEADSTLEGLNLKYEDCFQLQS